MKSRLSSKRRARQRRTGLRIHGSRGNNEVRKAILRFSVWLRSQYQFPIRVPVYLLPGEAFRTMYGELVVASFVYPARPNEDPYIRIATGDYPALKTERGRDNALSAILHSLARQIARYQIWVATNALADHGVSKKGGAIMKRYMKVVDHP